MDREAAKRNLYDVATKGDLARFKELVGEEEYLIDEVWFSRSRNLLHIATMRGQEEIVEELLKMNAELARDLDSTKSSPLHIAAAQGNLGIAKKLLQVAPEICWWRDCHDMNPVHIAAVKGHVEVLQVLLEVDLPPAMERLHRGQTVLHLCVKHGREKALDVLVEKLGHLLNAKDDDGETILHLAVRCYQVKIAKYLVEEKKIKRGLTNLMDKRAADVLREIPPRESQYSEMNKLFTSDYKNFTPKPMLEFLTKKGDQTMVVMILIATMAFQATVSPPGGVWQDDTSSHKAGEAVMASTHPKIYNKFLGANTTAFASSIITIFFFTFQMQIRKVVLVRFGRLLVWVSLAAIAVSYGASTIVISPNMEGQSLDKTINIVVGVSLSIFPARILFVMVKDFCSVWKRELHDLLEDSATSDPSTSVGV